MRKSLKTACTAGFLALASALTACSGDSPEPQQPAVGPPAASAPPTAQPTAADPRADSGARALAGEHGAPGTIATATPVAADAWRATGSVHAAIPVEAGKFAPIAGAELDFYLRTGDGRETALAHTQSAADGTFAVALEHLPPLITAGDPARVPQGPRLVARVGADGYQALEASMPFTEHAERALAFDVRLQEGANVLGRAVDADGHPVAFATAALSIANEVSGPGGLRLLVESQADGEGRFALGFGAPTKFILSVRADGVGVHSREVEVEARKDKDLGDVPLTGGPPLGGVALHLDGTPARQLDLWALEGELAFQPDGFKTAVRRTREVERGEGLSWSRAQTDAQGRFEFRGLKPEHYAIKSADDRIVIEPRQARFEPGQTNLELTVHTPMLIARVVDAEGRPVPGATIECTELGLEADGSFTPGDTRREVARGPEAAVSFSADPETPMALRARFHDRMTPETIVFLGVGTQHKEQVLVLAPRARTGVLHCTVEGTDPADVSVRVAFASPATGYRDEDIGVLEADAQGVVRDVPVGSHVLFCDFGGEAGPWFFPWKSPAPVVVAAQGETNVHMEPERGARLTIRCELSGPPPSDFTGASSKRQAFGARIVLAPVDGSNDGRGERSLDLVLDGASEYLLLPDESADARDLLPAGDWILRVEGLHWRPTRTPIRLTAGRKLSVVIDLIAR